ncbi:MAG: hypothetical protein KBB91_02475 [Candidatus Pacebacteria bacterium]|nr:hypothetical protein [Candidatus Paceibacterota bacterium]MBP9701313.1 hypothetical protein [Candidatus Paceibacterota bacterium]
MKTFTINLNDEPIKTWDIHLGQTFWEKAMETSRDPAEFLFSHIQEVFPIYSSEISQKLLVAYAQRYKLPLKGCILQAHGTDNENWNYYDEYTNTYHPVSSFIENNDGKYGVIVLCVCNVNLVLPKTKRSCIIFGDGMIGAKTIHGHTENMYRALPVFENVQSYTFEYDTATLQKETL